MTPMPGKDPQTAEALALTCDFTRSLPGGTLDDSTYSAIEDALDKIEAPMKGPDGRWLTLVERIAALSPASTGPGEQDAGAEWREPDMPPTVKVGGSAFFVVAVRRKHDGRVYSFPATYLNAAQLWFEDDNETRAVTGWYSLESEGDDQSSYQPVLTEGDELIAWTDVPKYPAPPTPASTGPAPSNGETVG